MAVTFPKLNPIIFKEAENAPFEEYNTTFHQKWNHEDHIFFQIAYDKSFNSGEVIAKLLDINDNEIATCPNEIINTPDTYHAIFDINCNIEEGLFRIKLTTPTNKFTFFSNLFEIGNHENSMLIQYRCKENKFDCIFTSDINKYQFNIRVDGGIKSDGTTFAADDIFYFSQDKTTYLVDSIPYNLYKYTFGDSYGVPIWIADRLNRIFACDNIKINNIVVVKNEGAKLETLTSNAYPYVGLKIELLRQLEGSSEPLYDNPTETLQTI